MQKPKISACLVVHNEEELLPRCLESLREVVDEIILIHDGPCRDKTLEIASEYGARIFVRDFIGEAEYHRPFSFGQATGDWILQIDADEFLSAEAALAIPRLVTSEIVSGYSFWWPYWTGQKYLLTGPFGQMYKQCLYRKKDLYMLGISHEYPRSYGSVQNVKDAQLCHQPVYNNFSWAVFKTKWLKWGKLMASQIVDLEKASLFNVTDVKGNPVLSHYYKVRRWPLFFMFWEPLRFCLVYLKKGLLWSNTASLKIAFLNILFRCYVNFEVWKLQLVH